MHYGKKDANCVTISSTLATQMPQATGIGYAMKRSKSDPKGIVVCYFGDGAGMLHTYTPFDSSLNSDCIDVNYSIGRRRPRSIQYVSHTEHTKLVGLPKQWICHFHAAFRSIPRRWHRSASLWIWNVHC